jgi:hypothetical protein
VILFQENKVEVLKRLKDGRIDYLDLTSWSSQGRLFGFLIEKRFLEWCASNYPTARELLIVNSNALFLPVIINFKSCLSVKACRCYT